MDIQWWVQLRAGLNEVPQGQRATNTQLVATATTRGQGLLTGMFRIHLGADFQDAPSTHARP